MGFELRGKRTCPKQHDNPKLQSARARHGEHLYAIGPKRSTRCFAIQHNRRRKTIQALAKLVQGSIRLLPGIENGDITCPDTLPASIDHDTTAEPGFDERGSVVKFVGGAVQADDKGLRSAPDCCVRIDGQRNDSGLVGAAAEGSRAKSRAARKISAVFR